MKKIIYFIICLFLFPIFVNADDNIPVERIMISADSLYLNHSQSIYMKATVYPSDATNKGVTWESSDTTIASIDPSSGGLATKSKTGSVTITATANDGSGVIGSIEFMVGYVNVKVGEETSIGNTNYVQYDTVNWYISDENVLARTGSYGKIAINNNYRHSIYVRGKSNGATYVAMSTISGEVLSLSQAYVYTPINQLTANVNDIELEIGNTKEVNVNIGPDTISPELTKLFYYMEDSSIASVDENGLVIAKKTGNTNLIISSQYFRKSITIPIRVVVYATDLTLSNYDITLNKNNPNYQVEYEILPSETTYKQVTYESNDTSIVKVTNEGKLIALKEGTAVVKAKTKDGKVTKNINVTVENFPECESITLNGDDIIYMNAGDDYHATYSIAPSDCVDTGVTWSVLNESIATVDNSGTVHAVNTGETTLIVTTNNGKTTSKKINVNNYVAVKSVSILDDKVIVTTSGVYPRHQIQYKLNPENPTYVGVSWSIEDEEIADIDNFGVVYGKKIGKTKAHIKTTDGNKEATVDVEVIEGHFHVSIYKEYLWYQNSYIEYPGKIELPNIEFEGYAGFELYKGYDNGVFYDKYVDGDFEYNGDYYNLYAKPVNPIRVESITITNDNYIAFGPDSPSFAFYFNDGVIPANTKVKLISSDNSIISTTDEWYECVRMDFENGKYVYHFYDSNLQFNKMGKVTLTLMSQDGSFTDTIVANYTSFEDREKTFKYNYFGEYTQENGIIIKDGTTVGQLLDVYECGNQYINNRYVGNCFFTDQNNNRITDLNTVITKDMKLTLTDAMNNPIDTLKTALAYSITIDYDGNSGYNYVAGYNYSGDYYWGGFGDNYMAGYDVSLYINVYYDYKLLGVEIFRDSDGKNVTKDLIKGEVKRNDYCIIEMPDYPITVKVRTVYFRMERPTLSIVKGNNNSLIINWNKQEASDKYTIYRSTNNKNWSQIAEVTENSYTDNGLNYGTTYYYKVNAYNSYNGYTEFSNVVSMKVIPNKTEELKVIDIGTNQVKLGWKKQDTVTGYEIARKTSENGKYTNVATVKNVDNYTNTKLSGNTTYYYKIRAYRLVGKTKVYGDYSDVIMVKTAPNAPKVVIDLHDYNTLAVNTYSVNGATKYEIYRSLNKNSDYERIVELPVSGNYKDSSLVPGKTYYYKVRVCNDENSCGNYSAVIGKTPVPTTPNINVTVDATKKIMVSYDNITGADGYEIQRSVYKNKKFTTIKTLDSNEYHDEVGLNTTYYYRVRAYTLVDEKKVYSGYSGVKSTKVTLSAPSYILTKTGINKVTLDMNEVSGAVGYEIQKSTYKNKKFSVVGDVKELTYSEIINLNTTYYYRIRSYILVNGKKAYSGYSSVKNTRASLTTPSYTLTKTDINKITLDINKVEGADGYEIYRSTNSKKGFVVVGTTENETYSEIINLNTTYYYKVRAYRLVNEKKNYSGYSSVKNVKASLTTPSYTLTKTDINKITLDINKVEGADGYEIQRSTNSKKGFVVVGTTENETYSEIINLNTTYYYKVRAYRLVNEKKNYSGYSSVKNTRASLTTPSYTLTKTDINKITLDINKVEGADGYEIQRSTNSKKGFVVVGTTENETYSEIINLNTTYYYKVRAYRLVNEKKNYSGYSSVKNTRASLTTPSYTLTKTDINKITLDINKVEGADGYEIQRSTNSKKGFVVVGTTNNESYSEIINLNTTYYYKVRAYRIVNEKKNYSGYSSVKSTRASLTTPTYTLVKNSINEVTINIDKVEGADGYEIQRSTNSKKGFVVVGTTDTETYNQTVNATTTYYYKVRAYRLVNEKKNYSGFGIVKTANKINLTKTQSKAVDKAKAYLKNIGLSYDRLVSQLEYEGFSNADAKLAIDVCNVNWNEQAIKSAKAYLRSQGFSYEKLVDQLENDKFTHEQAVYGVDNCGANWNEQAVKRAKEYLNIQGFSYGKLVIQLEYEQFTYEQAVYGVDNCGANWNEQALKRAKEYTKSIGASYDGLIDQLEYEQFTHEQAVYGVNNCEADWNEQALKEARSYINIVGPNRDSLISHLEYKKFNNTQINYALSALNM